MSFLEISDLRKTFGTLVAVDDVGFTVEPREIFGLLGPNGAGKSTTMMMLAGLIEPDSGCILLGGNELCPRDRMSRRPMGVVPQDLAIYPNLTARENLRFFGRLYGVNGAKLETRTDDVLQLTGLTERANDLTHTFSGGMKRRLNFGVALLHEPRLLILDEPTVGVDPQSRAHLLQCVRELCDGGVSVIYCSHYMEEVQELCDRVAIIDHGRLLVCDRIEQLLGQVDFELRMKVNGISRSDLTELSDRDEISVEEDDSYLLVSIRYSNESDPHHLTESLASVLRTIEHAGGSLTRLDADEPDLERLFLKMTGSRLRD